MPMPAELLTSKTGLPEPELLLDFLNPRARPIARAPMTTMRIEAKMEIFATLESPAQPFAGAGGAVLAVTSTTLGAASSSSAFGATLSMFGGASTLEARREAMGLLCMAIGSLIAASLAVVSL
jgi:hypothetical protein